MSEFDEQLREIIPRLRRFAVSLTRNSSSADDLVQASLERALSAWGEKRADGDVRAGCSRSSIGNFSTRTVVRGAMRGCWNFSPVATMPSRRWNAP